MIQKTIVAILKALGGGVSAFDSEEVTVAGTAIGLTSGTYGDAIKAELTLEVAQIRVEKDGSDPTSSVGHVVDVGNTILLSSPNDIANFKAIRTGTTSGVLKVTYSK